MMVGLALTLSVILAVGVCLGTGAFGSLMWLWVLPVSFAGGMVASAALSFLFLVILGIPVRRDVPQKNPDPFYQRVVNQYAKAALWALQARVKLTGAEKIPQQGRFLMVCNHLSDLDPVTLLAYFGDRYQLTFISKRENEDRFVAGKILHKIAKPIHRENDREALKTILECIRLIKEDVASVAVFPEGYTSLDGQLHNFRHGVFKIAQKANVPVVVCTIQNTQKLFHNAPRLRPTPVPLHVLAVIPAEEVKAVTAVELGERVHAMMAADLENT